MNGWKQVFLLKSNNHNNHIITKQMLTTEMTVEQRAEWCASVSAWLTKRADFNSPVENVKDIPTALLGEGVSLVACVRAGRDVAKAVKNGAYDRVPHKILPKITTLLREEMNKWQAPSNLKAPSNLPLKEGGSKTAGSRPIQERDGEAREGLLDERGRKISEYLYMLPVEMGGDALVKKVDALYLEMADLRSEMEHAETDEERAAYAQKLQAVDAQLRRIYAKVDKAVDYFVENQHAITALELESLMADEEGTAEKKVPEFAQQNKRPAEFTKAEIDAIEDPAQQEFYRSARIEASKKYLRKNPESKGGPKLTQAWIDEVRLRARELYQWGESIDGKSLSKTLQVAGISRDEITR